MEHPRICILAGSHMHDDARMYKREACSLQERGCEVTILCSGYEDEGDNDTEIRFQQIKIPRGPVATRRLAWRYWKAARNTCADFYHFYDEFLLPGAKRMHRQGKVIFDCFYPRHLEELEIPKRRKVEQAIRRLYAIIVETQSFLEPVQHLNRRSLVLCNYPLPQEFHPDRNPEIKRVNGLFGFIGSFTQESGFFMLLKAIGGSDFSLLAQGGFWADQDRAQGENDLGWKNVQVLPVGESRNTLFAQSSAVVIVPENDGNTAYEELLFSCMAAEVPVIISNFSDWVELVDEAGCGVCVDPSRPEEIRNAMEYIRKNPDIAREMGQNGKRRALARYNWNKEKEKLYTLYRIPTETAD